MLVLICCSKQPQVADVPIGLESAGFSGHKSRALVDPQAGSFFVRENDLQAYLKYKRLADKKEYKDAVIDPLVDQQGDTVMYAINYPSAGWELIAADKRCPVVLASDSQGWFAFDEQIPPVQTWLRGMGEDVKCIRAIESYDEVKDQESVQKMRQAEVFWKMITADPDYIKEKMEQTKSGLDPIPYVDGTWEITDIVWDTLSCQFVNHLIQTHWVQGSAYNAYCPFKSYSVTERAPAGCVAVAVGQVANYFHDNTGYPSSAPLTAYCDVQVPYYYPFCYIAYSADPHLYVSDLSPTAWNTIPSSEYMCSKLLLEIGIATNMNYGDSCSFTSSLGEQYFANKSFTYTRSGLDPVSLISNITNGKPVIAGAFPQDTTLPGHAFIIDAYDQLHVKITTYYEFVPNEPVPWGPLTTYEEEYMQHEWISMNWGFGAIYDNTWYSIMNSWTVNGSTFVTNNREMLYNLTAPL